MRLDRRIKIQLAIFTVIAVAAGAVMIFRYIDVPAMLFGVGRYTVTVDLQRGRRAVSQRQRHLPGHRGRPGRQRPLTDTGVGRSCR